MTRYEWLQDQVAQFDRSGWPPTCVEWPFARSSGGYGQVQCDGRQQYVHRVVSGGGEATRHRCDNPPCFNRTHLIVGTQAENIQDMLAKGRHVSRGLGPEVRSEIVRRYLAGERSSVLAPEFGINIAHVSKLVRQAGHSDATRARWGRQGRGRADAG